MKIITLMENTAASPEIACGHGLSFYIETKNHKILFDMGPDARFLENAEKLGVDIKKIDIAILSHGHYDHGGGIQAFLEANTSAFLHVQTKVFGEFYAKDEDGTYRYIGLPQGLQGNPRIILHTGDYKLDGELQVFGGVTGRECYSPANDSLKICMKGHYIQDLFMHEQNLLIKEGNKMVLVAGCAHNGVINILKKADTFTGGKIDYVLGGMHLRKACKDMERAKILTHNMAERLKERSCRYYTCHCTGKEAYEMLHEEMGKQIQYLPAGSILNF